MKNYFSFITLLFVINTVGSSVFASQNHVFKTNRGTRLYVMSDIHDDTRPTLLLLPGIYRGYLENENILQILSARKINWVSLHFSRHPESVLSGSTFFTGMTTTQELVDEVVQLKRAMKIKRPVLVSLSFSGTLSPHWNRNEFPYLIETSPMGRHDESAQSNPAYESWQQWMNLFPVWGPWLVQSSEYWGYRGYWLQKTEELAQTHDRYKASKIQIAEGLAQLAWSSRGFDIRKQDFARGPERFWILGQKEFPLRLRYQMEAVQIHRQLNPRSQRLYLIPNAGHIITNDQPEAYALALEKILRRTRFQ